jgi:hypothetical protein
VANFFCRLELFPFQSHQEIDLNAVLVIGTGIYLLFSWVDFYHVLAVGCVIYHEDHHDKESVLVKIRVRGVLQILLSEVTIRVFFRQTLTLVQNHLFLSV